MTTDHLNAWHDVAPSSTDIAMPRRWRLYLYSAIAVIAVLAYTGAVTYLLSNSTAKVYGFPVTYDVRTLIEIALQICPMLAAFTLVLISPATECVTVFFVDRVRTSRTFMTVAVSVVWAIVMLAATAVALKGIVGPDASAPPRSTLLWIAAEFAIDVTLIGIFTAALYALTRRLWATVLLFLGYVVVVVLVGPRWGITSYIGFGSTVPVMLTTYSSAPLYDTAGWLFRGYWICITLLILSVLHAVRQAPGLRRPLRPPLALPLMLLVICALAFLSLFRLQRQGIAKYETPSETALNAALRGDKSEDRLHLAQYDVRLNYTPEQETVTLEGALTFRNDHQALRTAYFQMPALMVPDRLDIEGAGTIQKLGKYLQVEFADPLPAGKHVQIRYAGVIRPAGPFDLTVQAKVLESAFFMTDSDIMFSARSAACLASASGCGNTENYLMSDTATGRISVVAPNRFDVFSAGEKQSPVPAGGALEHVFTVPEPRLATFMVACAPFVRKVAETADGTKIHVYRSAESAAEGTLETALAESILSFYQTAWPAYRHRDLHIIETPTPLGEALAFDGAIAISDKIIASRNPVSGVTSNLLEFVMAHEIAHQWWGYRVIPARSPGRLFLLESFPQFAAYKYLSHRGILSGQEAAQNEKRRYEFARARRRNKEMSLAQFETGTELAYNKGAYVLLSLDGLGGPSLMNRLGGLIRSYSHDSQGNARPDQFMASFIDDLPESGRQTARALIYGAP